MKICIPVTGPEGLQASIVPLFTDAEYLMVFNLQSGEHHTISHNVEEGQRENAEDEPIAVDAVLCSGMGKAALHGFTIQGIQVFTTKEQNVGQALQALQIGEVEELLADNCCGGHSHAKTRGVGCSRDGHGKTKDKHECGGECACGQRH